MGYSIGIDIGGTKCAVILGKDEIPRTKPEGFLLDRMCFPTEAAKGPGHTIENLLQTVERMLKKHSINEQEVIGIGVSCGGPLDHVKGVVLNPPNLYGWNGIPIVKLLTEAFSIPAYLQNDANACALAEWRFGAARGCKNVVFLTFGTGMGAGLILDGRLYSGASDMAGEIGHVRLENHGPVGYGKAGSFEGFCSGGGIAQVARYKVLEKLQMGESPAFCPDLASLEGLSARKVAEAAMGGDALAKEIYAVSGRYLGMGLSVLIDLINPEMIVIGSVYARSGELLRPSAEEVIQRETLRRSRECCKIVPAELGDKIGDYAAVSVAFQGGMER